MPSPSILPDPQKLDLICLRAEAQCITLTACTTAPEAGCSLCGKSSDRVHSRYVRTLTDLLWQVIPVRMRLHVRRFVCEEPTCKRQIFAERLTAVTAYYARRALLGWMRGSFTSRSPSEEKRKRGFCKNSGRRSLAGCNDVAPGSLT